MNKKASEGEKIRFHEEGGSYDYLSNSASSSDCTGLLHKPAENEEELEAYEEVYDFLPPNGEKLQ